METVVLLIGAVPLVATLVAWWGRASVGRAATVVAGLGTFGLSLSLVGRADSRWGSSGSRRRPGRGPLFHHAG